MGDGVLESVIEAIENARSKQEKPIKDHDD